MSRKLPRSFYDRPTLTVAQELLGQLLVRQIDGERLSGRIVETEAYMGPGDEASHARYGPNSRAATMFGPPGHAYVYFTYGMHYCFNCVTEAEGSGTAVLIRAIEPLEGIERMRHLRGPRVAERDLANGPAKLCQALEIDAALNQADLTGDALWLETGSAPMQIKTSPRVGISRGREHHYRFYDAASVGVSAHPKY
jgi:DNA-3-methyladenine glycosylase